MNNYSSPKRGGGAGGLEEGWVMGPMGQPVRYVHTYISIYRCICIFIYFRYMNGLWVLWGNPYGTDYKQIIIILFTYIRVYICIFIAYIYIYLCIYAFRYIDVHTYMHNTYICGNIWLGYGSYGATRTVRTYVHVYMYKCYVLYIYKCI
jgi:hypothetical protein